MYNPVATYRIQFHKDFTLADLKQILPYLQRLGVRTIYASPIFEAVAGSTHGYDQVNPLRINPELGTLADLEEIHTFLSENKMGWVQDIVPNHMAYDTGNLWLMDVLRQGRDSPYAGYFDTFTEDGQQLLAPFLGQPLADVLQQRELRVVRREGRWWLRYFEAFYPLNDASLENLSAEALLNAHEQPKQMTEILNRQHYRLCFWQESNQHINYRRFFTVNGLICLHAEEAQVFEATHAYLLSLLRKHVFQGLRVDHIDGLLDPAAYLKRLRLAAGDDAYIVVEKVLESREALPVTWPVQGTTGYGFLAQVNNLLTWQKSKKKLTEFYKKITGQHSSVPAQLMEKKQWILENRMQGELENLTRWLLDLQPNLTHGAAKGALSALLLSMPQYRFYGNSLPLSQTESDAVAALIDGMVSEDPDVGAGLRALRETLLEMSPSGDTAFNKKAIHLYQRLMQLSGPLMAKGMEDTLMYTYHRFLGHNEVGDSPDNFGLDVMAFHQLMQERQQRWPLALNATATHDTKRGEDARALLNVLSAIPDAWIEAVGRWQDMNRALKKAAIPGRNMEYFLYQTLFATWPLNPEEQSGYGERLKEYLRKALREAKLRTNWADPDEHYEKGVIAFADHMLDTEHPFFSDFLAFRKRYEDFGMVNGLVQATLKCFCPGVPDVYQGTELWDQSFVDPDNRRPVAYGKRAGILADENVNWQALWPHRTDGRIKARLLQELLHLRGQYPYLFEKGTYLPLKTTGRHAWQVLAFVRQYKDQWLLVIAGLYLPLLCDNPAQIDWEDTSVQLPPLLAEALQQQTDTTYSENSALPVAALFHSLLLYYKVLTSSAKKRGAGILAALSSLPGPFGMGDLGPEACRFAQMLGRHGWRYWQLLPLNPTDAGSGYSPYSSVSTMAGNPLFISPEWLAEAGLLTPAELKSRQLPGGDQVDYPAAERNRKALLYLAWRRFQTDDFPELSSRIVAFSESESGWLNDYALYCVLKAHFKGQPWYEWPEAYRLRDKATLQTFATGHNTDLAYHKFLQALFSFQMLRLRTVCLQAGVTLIGDLPFYASYDSVDVWSHQELFAVAESGRMEGVAGVPPDYFSETGQLWAMPTFRWERMKADGYAWWISRLRKNLTWYGLLRIDHFRALSSYWEVPAGSENAIHGQWLPGPGLDFLKAAEKAFGGLPFIAEDLGDNLSEVYQLRDAAGLPGMRVLQFAFGANLPESVDAPHNYLPHSVAYTGTHDNNTLLGWYRREASAADRDQLQQYAGYKITEKNLTGAAVRLLLASVSDLAIVPLQDLLGLDETARMNTPGTAEGNWSWRMSRPLTGKQAGRFQQMLKLFGRA